MGTEIWMAVLVVAGVGLICGIVIAVASCLMGVQEDEKSKALRDCLPGANCGACGYTGCDGYAKALSLGECTKTNLCVPGADATAVKIAAILGVAAEDVVEKVAVIACNGSCGVTEKKQNYEGMASCAASKLLFGGNGACTYGCLGYGDCAKVCPNRAICLADGVARIDSRVCIGCGLCATACPNHLIHLIPDVKQTVVLCSNKEKGAVARKKCKNACIACKKCENTCPNGAIHVVDNVAVIDTEKCSDCGLCSTVCPVGCIRQSDLRSANHPSVGGK